MEIKPDDSVHHVFRHHEEVDVIANEVGNSVLPSLKHQHRMDGQCGLEETADHRDPLRYEVSAHCLKRYASLWIA